MKKMSKTIGIFILGVITSLAINVAAEAVISSGAVSYSNTTVSAALDELFSAVDINKKIGTTDISTIGDGTITGALSNIDNQLNIETFVTKGMYFYKFKNFVYVHIIPSELSIDAGGSWLTTISNSSFLPKNEVQIETAVYNGNTYVDATLLIHTNGSCNIVDYYGNEINGVSLAYLKTTDFVYVTK